MAILLAFINILTNVVFENEALWTEALISSRGVDAFSKPARMLIGGALVSVYANSLDEMVTWVTLARIAWGLVDALTIQTGVVETTLIDIHTCLIGHFKARIT